MATKPETNRPLTIDVTATFAERPDGLPPLVAYLFTRSGTLLAQQSLDKDSRARLPAATNAEPQALRVVIGPEIAKDALGIAEVLRRGGVERHVALRPGIDRLSPVAIAIGPEVLKFWLGSFCRVQGTLLKQVVSGGITLRLPVCNATIDIYEVDPWPIILPTLPDIDIDRLRDIVDGPWPPIDLPIPPRPEPDPSPIRARASLAAPLLSPGALRGFNPQPEPPRGLSLSPGAVRGFDPQPDPPSALPASLKLAARASRPVFERALIANIDLLRPIFCWLYPLWVTKQKIATVTTDECGHFSALIWKSWFNPDQPDLYFIARQRIFPGFWITIYEKLPVACHTWWNYQCGTEVTLVTTHPFAHACPPCPPIVAPNNWVLFMAVGNTSVWRIHGANDATAQGTGGFDATRHGLLDNTRPWGGTLRPRLEFDSSLRISLGVKYYRVLFKRPSEPESAWRPSIEALNRHYTVEIGGDLILQQYPLGPNTVGATSHLYEIPPALPPAGQWSIPNAVLDTQSAVIPTNAVAPGVGFDAAGIPLGPDEGGLWQIAVELFNAAGTKIDPEVLGIAWRVPMSNDLSGTITTRNAADIGLVDTVGNRMVVTVRVDNNPALARIGAPTLNGAPAGSECGVLTYTAAGGTVEAPFHAVQRNGFATYNFAVIRGAGPGAVLSASGTASTSIASPPATPTGSAAALLGACAIAGFSENLYVRHLATDGWSDQIQLDRWDVRAFVLAPSGLGP
ncbi:MAG: hypothetical protein IT555_19490 [Acetobacteraceae bacterium]|nr:hypothetical protein [Acetobacteraceae bacterium]